MLDVSLIPSIAATNIFFVKEYGAVGDGINDDSLAIQATIDDAHAAGGGTVFFSKGRYKKTLTINLYARITLLGEHYGSVEVFDAEPNTFWQGKDCDNFHLENLILTGPGINAAGGGGMWLGIDTNINTQQVVFRNIKIQNNASYGLLVEKPINGTFDNCNFSQNVGDGLWLKNGTSCFINSSSSTTNMRAGYFLDGMSYTSLNNCASQEMNGLGFYLYQCNSVTLTSCGSEAGIDRGTQIIDSGATVEYIGIDFLIDGGMSNTLTSCSAIGIDQATFDPLHAPKPYSYVRVRVINEAANCEIDGFKADNLITMTSPNPEVVVENNANSVLINRSNFIPVNIQSNEGLITNYSTVPVVSSNYRYDVKKFGAYGDGIHDDSAAIQAAIDAAHAAGGGTVYFPIGRYKKSTDINLYMFITLLGEHFGSVEIFDSVEMVMWKGYDCQYLKMENLILTGPGIDGWGGGGVWLGIQDWNCLQQLCFRNMLIQHNASFGLCVDIPVASTFDNCKFYSNAGDGLWLRNGTSVTINNCYSITNTRSGFMMEGMAYCSMNACAVENSGIGYFMYNTYSTTLTSCGNEGNNDRGRQLNTDLEVVIDYVGNDFVVMGGYGVTILSCSGSNLDQALYPSKHAPLAYSWARIRVYGEAQNLLIDGYRAYNIPTMTTPNPEVWIENVTNPIYITRSNFTPAYMHYTVGMIKKYTTVNF